jgi:hypothetical protein
MENQTQNRQAQTTQWRRRRATTVALTVSVGMLALAPSISASAVTKRKANSACSARSAGQLAQGTVKGQRVRCTKVGTRYVWRALPATSKATETTVPRAATETTVPRAATETTVPRAATETTVPRAATETTVPGATAAAAPSAVSGTLAGSGQYRATGTVRLERSASGATLRFANSSISDGPALSVYLVPAVNGRSLDGALKLGTLKANTGDHSYALPASADPGAYRSVVIWCDRFNVLFGSAALT